MTDFITSGRPALVLAPMEGVTDYPMRRIQSGLGGFSYCITEFIRVSGHVLNSKVFKRHVPEWKNDFRTDAGVSVQVQLLGGSPERLAESAMSAIRIGARAIDLNFGCPAPTVNKHDGGATLLKYPERLEEIIRVVRSRVPSEIPVSAKIRLGWDDESAVLENVVRAEKGGASWITIHARTRMQGYQPPAFWKWIGEARKRVSIPVVANGDIWSVDDFERCREITGCEHFMVGRGALADPGLPLQIAARLGILKSDHRDADYLSSLEPWLPLLREFSKISIEQFGRGPYVAKRVKQWLRYSAHHHKTPWFEAIKRVDHLEELLSALEVLVRRDQKCSTSKVFGASTSSSTQQPMTLREIGNFESSSVLLQE